MELVATLLTSPARCDLSDRQLELFSEKLKTIGGTAGSRVWLNESVACDIFFDGPTVEEARALVRREFSGSGFDIVIQRREERRKKLLLADMDSTIVTGETLDELADQAGMKDRIAKITARAMRGEIDFRAALRERVAMLKGLPVDCLARTLTQITPTPGARELVQTMRDHGAFTVLVSGGFRFFTREIASAIGFHEDHANDLVISNGRLTGEVAEPILDKESKLNLLEKYAKARGIPVAATIATGDGANDLPMIRAAGLGVAFHAKPVVDAEAPAAIRHGDLTALLYLQGYNAAQFKS